MPVSQAERSILASIAANERWSRTSDRAAATATARKAFSEHFENLVDPEGKLTPDERARRAASARRAHMQRLALRSARSRRAAAGARGAAAESARAASDLERLADDADAQAEAIMKAAS